MIANITWVEAKLNDSKVASLLTKLVKTNKTIETGSCGCGCGCACAHPNKSQTNAGVKHS
jgi:hypothetical protein